MMERQDLSTCIMISKKDVELLRIKLDGLQKIDNFRTSSIKIGSFFNSYRRLKKYIEKSAEREGADLAVITREHHEFGSGTEFIAYEYSLYKYK